jgi:hypothetical protein
MWHSCVRRSLEDHLSGKDPDVRRLFRSYLRLVRSLGPVTVYANKTGIVFQARVRFAGAVPRRQWLEGRLWLKRRVHDPRFYRIEAVTPRDHIYYFRIRKPHDLDARLEAYLREAYSVGLQAEPGGRVGASRTARPRRAAAGPRRKTDRSGP